MCVDFAVATRAAVLARRARVVFSVEGEQRARAAARPRTPGCIRSTTTDSSQLFRHSRAPDIYIPTFIPMSSLGEVAEDWDAEGEEEEDHDRSREWAALRSAVGV